MANVIGSDTGGGASSTNTINSIPMPDLIPGTIYAPDGKTVLISNETKAGWAYDGDQKSDQSRTDNGGTNTGGKTSTKKKTTQTCKFVIKYDGTFGGMSYDASSIDEENNYYGWSVTVDGDTYGLLGKPPDPSSEAYSGAKQSVTLELTIKPNEGLLEQEEGIIEFCGWKSSNGTVYLPGQKVTHTWSSGSSGTYTLTLVPRFAQTGYFIYAPDEYTNEQYSLFSTLTIGYVTPKEPLLSEGFTRTGYALVGWSSEEGAHPGDPGVMDLGSSNYLAPPGYDHMWYLWPVWNAIPYLVTFYVGETELVYNPAYIYGGSFTPPETNDTWDPGTGTERIIPEELVIGRSVAFWNESPDGSGTTWIPGQEYTMTNTEDVTPSIWERTH